MISTIACVVVAGISFSTWAWRGAIPPTGREAASREQKAGAEPVADRTNAAGATAKVAPPSPAATGDTAPAPAPKQAPPASAGTSPPPAAPGAANGAATRTPAERSAAAADDTVAPVPLRPTELVRSPSLYETGRIGKAAVNEPGVPGNRRGERTAPPEMLVEAKQSDRREGATPASYTGVIDQAVLDREIAPRFRLLGDCKADVAHRKRVAASSITGSQLLLRWTILPNGRVTDTQILATAPADPRLLDCVKERMSSWSFRPGQGGSSRVERKFTFR